MRPTYQGNASCSDDILAGEICNFSTYKVVSLDSNSSIELSRTSTCPSVAIQLAVLTYEGHGKSLLSSPPCRSPVASDRRVIQLTLDHTDKKNVRIHGSGKATQEAIQPILC